MLHYPTEISTENGHATPVVLKIRQLVLHAGREPGDRLVLDDYDVEYPDGTPVDLDVLDEAVDLADRAARAIEAMIIYA